MRKFSVLLFVLCTLGVLSAQKATANPWVGTWTLDVSQSKFPEGHMPKSETLHISAASKNAVAYHLTSVDEKGVRSAETYHSAGNGKEGNLMRDGKAAGKQAFTKKDDNTFSSEGESPDGAKWTMDASLSDDQKTMTANFHFTPAQGSEYDQTEVYKKK